MKAIFNGQVVADSDETIVIEGNHYFPRSSLRADAFERTDHETFCGWKGTANYFTVSVDGSSSENAAWTYESPKEAAEEITDYVAFYRSQVDIVD